MLIEGKTNVLAKEKVDLITTDLVQISLDKGHRLLPRVTLDENYFHDLRSS